MTTTQSGNNFPEKPPVTNCDEKPRITWRLILTICGAAMGSLQFGYNLGVINAPEQLIKDFMNETQYNRDGTFMSSSKLRTLWSLTTSIFAVGGCIGGFCGGWWASKLGRKRGSLANTITGIVAGALMFASKRAESYEMIIVGRIIVGIHSGLYSALTPMYLSEVSTSNIRGAIGVLHQLAVVTGMLISQILGFPVILGNDNWDILLGLAVVPCIFQLFILPVCPESPRYLMMTKNNEKQCRDALTIIRGMKNCEAEIDEMKSEMRKTDKTANMISLFTTPSLRKPMIIGIVMQLSQQLSGINAVFFYSTNLFENVLGDEDQAKYVTSAVGAIMVVMTLITVPLMDRLGRRTLHLSGLIGMTVFSILVTITLALRDEVDWFDVASIPVLLTYVVFFALGPGSIPWLIVAELFSHGTRPAAMSVCVLVNWLSSFLVGFIFPEIQKGLDDYCFLPFTGCLVLFVIFTFFKVPETKGKSFEEVVAIFGDESLSMEERPNTNSETRNGTDSKYGATNMAFNKDQDRKIQDESSIDVRL